MKAEIQNQLWAILPKEARVEVKVAYGIDTINKHFDNSYNTALIDIFGLHNLTSDTEPEEILMVERKKVMEYYKAVLQSIDEEYGDTQIEMEGRKYAMRYFFGDKCLPDKTPEEKAKEIVDTIKDDIDNPIQMPENMLMPSIQVEPKFSIGQKVRAKGTKQIGIIKEPYSNDVGYRVYFEDGDGGWDKEYSVDELELYVEQSKPKFEVGDKVYQTTGQCRHDEYTVKKVYADKERGIVYDIQGLITIIGVKENELCWTNQNPYTK